MKIRMDFVTNSSSSSYIIAYKKIDSSNVELFKLYNNIINAFVNVESSEDTRKGTILRTKDEFDKYFIEQNKYGSVNTLEKIFEDEEGLEDTYNTYIRYINNGYGIICKDIDNNDEGLYHFVNEIGKGNDTIIIIEDVN